MDIGDKINIINQRMYLIQGSILTIQNNIKMGGTPKPGPTFEQMLEDLESKKAALQQELDLLTNQV